MDKLSREYFTKMNFELLKEIENFDKKTLHNFHHINIRFLKSIKHLNPKRIKKNLIKFDNCYRYDLKDGTCLVGQIGYVNLEERKIKHIYELPVNKDYEFLYYYSNFLCINNNNDHQIIHLYDENSKYGFARYFSVSRADYRRFKND